jgi:hypothetical protein
VNQTTETDVQSLQAEVQRLREQMNRVLDRT